MIDFVMDTVSSNGDIVAIVVICALAYYFWSRGPKETTSTQTTEPSEKVESIASIRERIPELEKKALKALSSLGLSQEDEAIALDVMKSKKYGYEIYSPKRYEKLLSVVSSSKEERTN